jgi:hypothetical protein
MRRITIFLTTTIFALSLLTFLPMTAISQTEQGLPELPNSSVSIPWSDFKDLIKELMVPPTPPPEPPEPPTDYSISESHYVGRLEGKSAVFDAEFTIDILAKNKWIEIPIISSTLAVSEVSMDGKKVTLRVSGGYYSLITNVEGRHVVRLTFYKPVAKDSGKVGINVPIPRVPVSTVKFSVPKSGMDFTISPANYKKTTSLASSSRLEAVLPVTGNFSMYWSPAVPEEISGELRVTAKVNTLISVEEGFLGGVSTINYEILHKSLSTFSFLLPKDVDIIDIKADGIRSWDTEPEGDRVKVIVNMSFEVSGNFSLAVIYEKNMGDKAKVGEVNTTVVVEIPEIEVLDVVREQVFLAVTKSTEVEVDIKSVENLIGLDTTDLPAELTSASENPILYPYKYRMHPAKLILTVTKNEDEEVDTCVIVKEELESLLTVRGDLVTRARFTIKNTTEQFLKLEIGEIFVEEEITEEELTDKELADGEIIDEELEYRETTIWSAFVSGKPVKITRDIYDRILIPLDRSVKTADGELTSFVVELTYITETKPFNKIMGWRNFVAPRTEFRVDEMFWTIHLPRKYVYKNLGEDMELTRIPTTIVVPSGSVDMYDKSDMDMPTTGEGYGGDDFGVDEEMLSMERKKEYAPLKSMPKPQIQTEMNAIRDNIGIIGGKSGRKRGVLPVRVDIHFSGIAMSYKKPIVKGGEESFVKFRFQGRDVNKWLSYIETLAWAVFFATLLFALRSAKKRDKLYINKDKSIAIAVSLAVIILLHLFFILDFYAVKWGFFWGVLVGGIYYIRDTRVEMKKKLFGAKENWDEARKVKSEKVKTKKGRSKKDEK